MEEKEKKTRTRRVKAKEEAPKQAADVKEIQPETKAETTNPSKNIESKPKTEAKAEAPKTEQKPAATPTSNIDAKQQISKQKSSISDIEVAKKLINIYQSAQDRRLQFNLSFEYVKRMLEYKTCYYTGRTFTEDGPNARSFDRVDSDKGYIEGNVVACTIEINGKKSNLSFEEISCLYHKLSANKEKNARRESEKTSNDEFSFSIEDGSQK